MDPALFDPWADVRKAIAHVLSAFWTTPTPLEAEVWGSYPLEVGVDRDLKWYPLARPYSLMDVIKTFLFAPRMLRRMESNGLALALSSRPVKLLVDLTFQAVPYRRKLLRRVQWAVRAPWLFQSRALKKSA